MRKTILQIILAFALLSLIGYNTFRLVDCSLNGDYVQLRLLRHGKNAVFGPDAIIDRDSILYSTLDQLVQEYFLVYFNYSTETIKLFIEDVYKYKLELGLLRTDTIEGITSVIDPGNCCPSYELKYVYINGEIVCFEDCGKVVEVEI